MPLPFRVITTVVVAAVMAAIGMAATARPTDAPATSTARFAHGRGVRFLSPTDGESRATLPTWTPTDRSCCTR